MDEGMPRMDPVLRLVWPEDMSQEMKKKVYHQRCSDCGCKVMTGDLHFHMRKNRREPKPLCPACAPKRGVVRDMMMAKGQQEAPQPQRIVTPEQARRVAPLAQAMRQDPQMRNEIKRIYVDTARKIHDKVRSEK